MDQGDSTPKSCNCPWSLLKKSASTPIFGAHRLAAVPEHATTAPSPYTKGVLLKDGGSLKSQIAAPRKKAGISMQKDRPLSLSKFWHGGDYNPEQWLETPHILEEDVRLMHLAQVNQVTVGVFSWASLQPDEEVFEFDWLDQIMDRMYDHHIDVILATPSGARPAWLAERYPEVLRVGPDGQRNFYGERHNHCFTSPEYRRLTQRINYRLAERYAQHPALKLWHISNEFSGECYCPLCQEAFRDWLRRRYGDLESLNRAWWTRFWSHTYQSWSQIAPPSPRGTGSLNGLSLDWKRFVTDQTVDFILSERKPLTLLTPNLPVTTNFMGTIPGLNYWKLAQVLDVISWDSYPRWHSEGSETDLACSVAFSHDLNRSLKQGQPFLLMESTPSMTNWQAVSKLKRPGMHLLSSLQAVAHGSDSVQYFQWRKSRGGSEKFHGAVVDHVGNEHTRVFADVRDTGSALKELSRIAGSRIHSEVAVIYDWENRWAIEGAYGPRREGRDYLPTCEAHYRAFWRLGTSVDVIDSEQDLSAYRVVVAPMLYMVRTGVDKRLEQFVEQGGTLILTYWSGIVDDSDLCFLGGVPGPLRRLTGILVEEIDALTDTDVNALVPVMPNHLGLLGSYALRTFCERIHPETATVLGHYGSDFYAKEPVLTVNSYGRGSVYYMAARAEQRFLDDFYCGLSRELHLERALDTPPPEGLSLSVRTHDETQWLFAMNFSIEPRIVDIGQNPQVEWISGLEAKGAVTLKPFGVAVFERPLAH